MFACARDREFTSGHEVRNAVGLYARPKTLGCRIQKSTSLAGGQQRVRTKDHELTNG